MVGSGIRRSRVAGPWTVDGRPVQVPGCWEDAGLPKLAAGPFEYRTTFRVPDRQDSTADGHGSESTEHSERTWLRFGAVSYACEVFVDGQEVGRHVGMWDAFDVEITSALRAGVDRQTTTTSPSDEHELLVRVEKPASLSEGPSSAPVAGRYPTPETLAGFLPYVWGHSHGGIWQPVDVVVTGHTTLEDVTAWGTPDGTVRLNATASHPGFVTMTVSEPDGEVIATTSAWVERQAELACTIPRPRAWSPDDPYLYTVHVAHRDTDDVTRPVNDQWTLRVGLREVAAVDGQMTLNGRPIFPRMVLSWGWYPDRLHPAPDPETVRNDFERLRRMGFNGVKLCLWFPPEYYFEIADELGMLLWVELPLWRPQPTEHFRKQLAFEVPRLVRAARRHPSVILYTLGCELDAAVGDDILGPLYASVKELVRDALVCDNSGSGEAYGGIGRSYADFYDHHPYAELHHVSAILDHFAPAWREPKPWLFGEFCDSDTFRDVRRLTESGGPPWWLSRDPATNPQGARWQFDVPWHEERLRANGFWDRTAELERISYQQSLLHRKVTIEAVRMRRDTSGYVVTGERDTPISTAGMWDDADEAKFDDAAFAAFNSDLVLGVGWDRRRIWMAGGDRPAYLDPWCYRAGDVVRPHVVLSHYGREEAPVSIEWTVGFAGEDPFASGTYGPGSPVGPGAVREVCAAEFRAPDVTVPRSAVLRVCARVGKERATNSWRLWFFPRSAWADVAPFAVWDPSQRLADLPDHMVRTSDWDRDVVVVGTRWTPDVAAHVRAGGRALLLADQASDCPVPVHPLPFWREAVKVLEPHPAWGDFPHDGWTDLQFAGCATDLALSWADWAPDGPRPTMRPILRRVDARTADVHEYAMQLGWESGTLIVSSLRFEGGLGDQPRGIQANVGAEYLLSRWIHWLQTSSQ